MLNIPNYLIVIAGSGRMLAQAARKSGFRPLVIDLFADLDTQSCAEDNRKIPSLAVEHLAPAVDYYMARYQAKDAVYGSGFEYHPNSLFYLSNRLNMLGNDPDTFIRLQHKQSFFPMLDQLGISHPAVSFTAPAQERGWLVKPLYGQGGLGIRRYRQNDTDCSSGYWQKFQQGNPHSVLFLANGHELEVIGFNSQWTAPANEAEPFVFSGVINCELPNELKQRISGWLNRLVPVFNLKGLNTLDFIRDDENCHVLEINPRPSASMQLYDGDWLTAHIKASQGLLAGGWPAQNGYKGYQIIYAQRNVTIPEGFDWPDGSMDLPAFGSIIGAGQPICSIMARHNEAQGVFKQLADTELFIINKLERSQTHAIQRQR